MAAAQSPSWVRETGHRPVLRAPSPRLASTASAMVPPRRTEGRPQRSVTTSISRQSTFSSVRMGGKVRFH